MGVSDVSAVSSCLGGLPIIKSNIIPPDGLSPCKSHCLVVEITDGVWIVCKFSGLRFKASIVYGMELA